MINPIGMDFNLTSAVRDEQINIFSMTLGTEGEKYSHQAILCQKRRFPPNVPQLLVPKKTLPTFKAAEIGIGNQKAFAKHFGSKGMGFPLKYVAFPAGVFLVEMDLPAMFDVLCDKNNGLFANWDPDRGPIKYFNAEDGNIQVFRVYEIDKIIPRDAVGRGRTRLTVKPYVVKVVRPVVSDKEFSQIIRDLHWAIIDRDCCGEFVLE